MDCPDCCVQIGELHELDCPQELCPSCGLPFLSCNLTCQIEDEQIKYYNRRKAWEGAQNADI